jgi:type I restriction enzyme S subunit
MTNNWQTKKLGEIFQIERGGSPRPIQSFLTNEKTGINWIKISDTKNITKYIYKTEEKIIKEGLKKSRLVNEGDFILSNSMSFGRPYIMKTTGAIHDGWLVLRKKINNIYPDFFYYLLSSPKVFDQFDKLASGSTVRNLNTKLVSNVIVSYPEDIAEQQRIVSILDQAFESIDKAKENIEKNIENSKELFENYFQNIFFKQNEFPIRKLGELTTLTTGGTPSTSKQEYYKNGSINWIVSGDIHKKEIFYCDKKITEEGLKNSNAKYLPLNSVLIALNGLGKTRGTVAILRTKATCNQSIVSIFPKDLNKITPEFIFYYLDGRYNFIRSITGDKDRRGLNMPLIRELNIPLPNLQEQQELINNLKSMKEHTNELTLHYRQYLDNLDELKKSILNKAFSGYL